MSTMFANKIVRYLVISHRIPYRLCAPRVQIRLSSHLNAGCDKTSNTGNNYLRHAPQSSKNGHHSNHQFASFPLGLTCGLIATYYLSTNEESQNSSVGIFPLSVFPVLKAATIAPAPSNRATFNFFADVVEKCSPAVVYIEIKDLRRFDYFSGEPFTASNGSGFVIESDGLILTNAHVVINKPHTAVLIKLQDGRSFQGTVDSVDPISDLATVRVDCKDLPTLKLGNSSDLRAGEWVVALGSPLALSNTVTAGVVSSTQRASKDLGIKGRDINYIQTDAAITFGNSGGPLINLDGEAIGLNSMKVTPGISFAIPIDYIKEFLKKSKEGLSKGATTHANRRYMGITMLTLTDDILKELRQRSNTVPSDVTSGVLVWKVIYGSPAHAGGLTPGDIITHINGNDVKTSSNIYDVLSKKGKALNISIYRGMNRVFVTVIPEDPAN